MASTRILALAGSTRRNSFNVRLLHNAADMAREAGAEVTLIDLADFPLPIFNQDDEAEHGEPASAAQLKDLFESHDGLLVASPEYNGLLTPLLKNTLDWVSRRGPDPAPMRAYTGKVAALVSASGGRLGGLRGLTHVRTLLTNLGVHVTPKQAAVSAAHDAFDDDGRFLHEHDVKAVRATAELLVTTAAALRASGTNAE